MKKKRLLYIVMFITITCFYNYIFINKADAGEISPGSGAVTNTDSDTGTNTGTDTGLDTGTNTGTDTGTNTDTSANNVPFFVPINSISIIQYPSKTIYSKGESLDLSDMIVQGYFSDGNMEIITDYEIIGFDSNLLGVQTVTISYQGQTATFTVTVIPAKVTNVSVLSNSTSSITLTWDAIPDAIRYEIYSYDTVTGAYVMAAISNLNSVTFNFNPGTIHDFQICAVEYSAGMECRGGFSDIITVATDPEAVTGLIVNNVTSESVSLSWNAVNGATGYLVYRSLASEDYKLCGTTDSNTYMNSELSAGRGYRYKVCAYTLNDTNYGELSSAIDTSTNPAKVAVKYKMGDQKVRITYTKVTGASYYDIYIGDDMSGYTLLTSRIASYRNYYVAEGLSTDTTYYFYVVARRNYKGSKYESQASDTEVIELQEVEETSMYAKYFSTAEEFVNSWSYQKIGFFQKNVEYAKSYIIPGLATTNVDGFTSTTMCPQGITFAENYLLQTAYDMSGEENSVIYVMNKKSKDLITTVILPSKTHAGGICYDGTNLWIPTGTKISSIPFSEIEAAVESGEQSYYVSYRSTCTLGNTVSYMTYYNDKLWVGTYNELEATNMYSYTIENKDTEPNLIQTDTIIMPTRVQGAAFTSKGTLILSRSCQLHIGLRGYIRQLDVYRPDFANEANGIIPLGEVANSVEMPSMNEGIAINGNYLYVNYESGAFTEASYKMDRICAFKLTSIAKKQKQTV